MLKYMYTYNQIYLYLYIYVEAGKLNLTHTSIYPVMFGFDCDPMSPFSVAMRYEAQNHSPKING